MVTVFIVLQLLRYIVVPIRPPLRSLREIGSICNLVDLFREGPCILPNDFEIICWGEGFGNQPPEIWAVHIDVLRGIDCQLHSQKYALPSSGCSEVVWKLMEASDGRCANLKTWI